MSKQKKVVESDLSQAGTKGELDAMRHQARRRARARQLKNIKAHARGQAPQKRRGGKPYYSVRNPVKIGLPADTSQVVLNVLGWVCCHCLEKGTTEIRKLSLKVVGQFVQVLEFQGQFKSEDVGEGTTVKTPIKTPRGLSRKEAARCLRKLHSLGAVKFTGKRVTPRPDLLEIWSHLVARAQTGGRSKVLKRALQERVKRAVNPEIYGGKSGEA